ncbi:MAG: hypothetical protein J2P17_00320 [Mycobacterium sp.]|nr:hypothetical protein [Mycobacterium sp.]
MLNAPGEIAVGDVPDAGVREIAIGRTIFYVADDGVLEQSSSSVPPSQHVERFEVRYLARQATGVCVNS